MAMTLVDPDVLVARATAALDRLAVGCSAQELFDVVAPGIGAVAGLFGAASSDGALFSGRVLHLPSHLVHSWMTTSDHAFQQTLLPITRAPDGELLLASDTVQPASASQMPVFEELKAVGLGAAGGYKLFQRKRGPLPPEHVLLAMFKESGGDFTPADGAVLRRLHGPMCEALGRSTLPLLSHTPIVDQILSQDDLGYICVSRSGRFLEANRRASWIVASFARQLGVHDSRDPISACAARFLENGKRRRHELVSIERAAILTAKTYRLVKESHVLPEDSCLIVLRESTIAAALDLSPKERQIALLLAYTSLAYKEIAALVGSAPGTVRVHVHHVYDKLRVESREELVELLRGAVDLGFDP